jgi:hypothetical protein
MAGTEMKNVVLIALVVLVIVFVLYQYDSSLCGLLNTYQGFANPATEEEDREESFETDMAAKPKAGAAKLKATDMKVAAMPPKTGAAKPKAGAETKAAPNASSAFKDMPKEGFANLGSYEGPANFGAAEAPAGCYPRDQITPSELLPKDMNSIWAEQNPMGPGSLKGKNFLSAGALIGVNTVGQSLRNANLQLRSEPPNPQVPVSIFLQSTIAPDISHRPLEIGA